MKAFTIYRGEWSDGEFLKEKYKELHGEVPGKSLGDFASLLWNHTTGRLCCVGFYLESCGVGRTMLTATSVAHRISDALPAEAKWLIDKLDWRSASSDAFSLYLENDGHPDDPKTWNREESEKEIARIFAKNGVTVTFQDGVRP